MAANITASGTSSKPTFEELTEQTWAGQWCAKVAELSVFGQKVGI